MIDSLPNSRRDSIVSDSGPSASESQDIVLRSRTPSVDIQHPLLRRGSSQGKSFEDRFENLEIRCKSGSQKRKVSGQAEESPFKVQLKHRESDPEAGFEWSNQIAVLFISDMK